MENSVEYRLLKQEVGFYQNRSYEQKVRFFELAKKDECVSAKKLFKWCVDNDYTEGVQSMLSLYGTNVFDLNEDKFDSFMLNNLLYEHCDKEVRKLIIAAVSKDVLRSFLERSIKGHFARNYNGLLEIVDDPEKKLIVQQIIDKVASKEKTDRIKVSIVWSLTVLFIFLAIIYKNLDR